MTTLLDECADLPQERIAAGDILVAEGSRPERVLVLVSGSVRIERDHTPFARIEFPGAVFGEMSWILGKPATATARAETDVVVHVIDDPGRFFHDRPRAAFAVLQMMAARLDGLTQYLVDVKVEFPANSGGASLIDQILESLVHHQAPRLRPGGEPPGE